MFRVVLKDFAVTGRFGPIEMGMSKVEVTNLLGPPGGEAEFSAGSTGMLYGWYEFQFCDDKLILIQNDSYDPRDPTAVEFRNDRFEVDPWFLRTPLPLTSLNVTRNLESEGLSYEIAHLGSPENGIKVIMLPSGFHFDFEQELEKLEDRPLIGFRYQSPRYCHVERR